MTILFIDGYGKQSGNAPHIKFSTLNLVSYTTIFFLVVHSNGGQSIDNEVTEPFRTARPSQ